MSRRTLKLSKKAKNKTRSRKQCGGGGWGYFGYDEKKDEEHFRQFYKDLGLGYRGGLEDANHEKVKETLKKLSKNMFKKYDINADDELKRKLRRRQYKITNGMVAILIKYGGLDVNKPDEYGHTFLYNALQHGDKDLTIAKYLINRKGTDLHVTTNAGTYLHALARNKNSVNNDGKINKEIGQAINYLRVTKGLNTESLDEYKKNFLHYIKRNKSTLSNNSSLEEEYEKLKSTYQSTKSSDKKHSQSPITTRSPVSLKPDDEQITIVEKIIKYTPDTNPYKVLGLKMTSNTPITKDMITKAYRKLSLQVHPDKCTILDDHGANKCDAAFKLINNAYDSLITQYNTI